MAFVSSVLALFTTTYAPSLDEHLGQLGARQRTVSISVVPERTGSGLEIYRMQNTVIRDGQPVTTGNYRMPLEDLANVLGPLSAHLPELLLKEPAQAPTAPPG